jgi:hypothetical protein
MAKRKTLVAHIRNTFLAHAGNNRRPHLFTAWGMVGATLLLVLVAAAPRAVQYSVLHGGAVNNSDVSSFFAAVLPAALLAETNTVREGQNLPVVGYSAVLSKAAQAKAEDMMLRQYFAHNSPEGVAPWTWFDGVGYDYQYAGENLAIHFNESADVVRAWVASPKHYENLIKTEYTEMGLGIASGMMDGRQTTVVVQFFASPAPKIVAVVEQPILEQAAKAVVASVTAVAEAAKEKSAIKKDIKKVAVAKIPDLTAVESQSVQPIVQQEVQPVVLGIARHEPTYLELFADNVYKFTILFLLAFLLALASLYVVHHYACRVHMPHLTVGTISLAAITLALITHTVYMQSEVVLPADVQFAAVAKTL